MTVLSEETPKEEEIFQTVMKMPKAHARAIIGVAYVKDVETAETYVATCAHDSLKIWLVDKNDQTSLTIKQEINVGRSGAQDFDITPDGTTIAIVGVDSMIRLIYLSLPNCSFCTNILNNGYMEQWHVRISPCKKRLFTVSFSGFLSHLNAQGTFEDRLSFPGARHVSSVASSADGKTIAVANTEGIVTVLNAGKLEVRYAFEAHAVKVRALCFSPSSDSLLTGSDDKIVKLYMIQEDKAVLVRTFCGHRRPITVVRFNPRDSQMLASSSNDGNILMWNMKQDRPVHIFRQVHEGVIKGLAFSLDGPYMTSVGEDRVIAIHRIGIQGATAEVPESQEPQASTSGLQQGYRASFAIKDHDADSLQIVPGSAKVSDEEEDELLARARRDIEGISDEERSPA